VSVEVRESWTDDAQPDGTIVGREPRVSRHIGQEISRHAKFWCGHDPAPEPDRPEDGITVGDYTFFLDNSGLITREPAEPTAAGAPAGEVLKLGCWSDPDQTK
jgi:hypothetical protein